MILVTTGAASMACVQKVALIVTITLWSNKHCSLLRSVCVCVWGAHVCVCVCMSELPEGGAVASTGIPNESLMVPVEGWASASSSKSILWTVPLSPNLPFALPTSDPCPVAFILAFTWFRPLYPHPFSATRLPLPSSLMDAVAKHHGSSYGPLDGTECHLAWGEEGRRK